MKNLLVTCITILLTFNMAWGESYIKFPNGDSYYGELRDGKPHRQGFLKYYNGKEFIGEFRDGEYVGEGKPSIEAAR
ncbi:hypothetical protein [Candidatus Nitrotoga sp. AM1P]|uniref:hypothetical protein n=1 Tax=Candidatus Nitrotoga sp. AM1P TaxID=2559597 RepID=UPI0015653DED|nr:hypothetical protein [Candidatus Nitrotoga sp. AM1P]